MTFRHAAIEDIPQMQFVRGAVKENVLSNPALVQDKDYAELINGKGKGWVCEENNRILGFAFADLEHESIWALFVDPQHEKKGIASQMHRMMLDWYFNQGKRLVWLSTAPNTRAETFYRIQGWQQNGLHGGSEIRFEMSRDAWLSRPLK